MRSGEIRRREKVNDGKVRVGREGRRGRVGGGDFELGGKLSSVLSE